MPLPQPKSTGKKGIRDTSRKGDHRNAVFRGDRGNTCGRLAHTGLLVKPPLTRDDEIGVSDLILEMRFSYDEIDPGFKRCFEVGEEGEAEPACSPGAGGNAVIAPECFCSKERKCAEITVHSLYRFGGRSLLRAVDRTAAVFTA